MWNLTLDFMRNVLAIVNPESGAGNGSTALDRLKGEADRRGVQVEVRFTEAAGDAVSFAREESLDGVDALISIGGDGTLNEVVNGLLTREDKRAVPIGILPAGTGNSLMKDFGCETIDQALKDIFSDKSFQMDLFRAEVDGKCSYGFNMVGCGFPSKVNEYAEASRAFKRLRYNVGVVKALFSYERADYSVNLPDSDLDVTSDFILMSNTRHIGEGIRVAPEARLDDGKLNLMWVSDFRRRKVLPLLLKLRKGTHLEGSSVCSRLVTGFSIEAPGKQEVNIDGEQVSFHLLQVSVEPGRITVLHRPADREEPS